MIGRKQSTEKGEMASVAFISAALRRGLLIAKPVADLGYDVIVHNRTTNDMWRVQVKCAGALKNGRYFVGSSHRKRSQEAGSTLSTRIDPSLRI
jgi:hypothetical protein